MDVLNVRGQDGWWRLPSTGQQQHQFGRNQRSITRIQNHRKTGSAPTTPSPAVYTAGLAQDAAADADAGPRLVTLGGEAAGTGRGLQVGGLSRG